MYPGVFAQQSPDKIAIAMPETGQELTYKALDENSTRLAHALREAGLSRGDVIALASPNDLRIFEVYWAALRSGLYITVINHNLKPDEIRHIARDSGASAIVASAAVPEVADTVRDSIDSPRLALAYGGQIDGYEPYEDKLVNSSNQALADQPHGGSMLYSSGTTGRPKGVRPTLPDTQITELVDPLTRLMGDKFGVDSNTVYLSPAPLYHAAPLRWSAGIHAYGGTVLVLTKYDPIVSLRTIQNYQVTHAQFVPTMFVRMLKLPDSTRNAFDVSSLRWAIHAAAPCPEDVKAKMIDWWGPTLVEYYGGTEANGLTLIDSQEWLSKRGSVGRPILGTLRICDDETGEVLPNGETGTIFWERDSLPFTYHNDPEKTRAAQHPENPTWTTLGDIGHVDDDGYLFLTDRKAFTIISGGVNIYPQEIENALALHPAVHDVAVIGIPDPEMGESVKAFVQPAPGAVPGDDLRAEIIAYLKERIAGYKCPKSVEFVDRLPRTETGKLVKGDLKNKYTAV